MGLGWGFGLGWVGFKCFGRFGLVGIELGWVTLVWVNKSTRGWVGAGLTLPWASAGSGRVGPGWVGLGRAVSGYFVSGLVGLGCVLGWVGVGVRGCLGVPGFWKVLKSFAECCEST